MPHQNPCFHGLFRKLNLWIFLRRTVKIIFAYYLNHCRVCSLTDYTCNLSWIIYAVFKNCNLDQLPLFKCCIKSLDNFRSKRCLSNIEIGLIVLARLLKYARCLLDKFIYTLLLTCNNQTRNHTCGQYLHPRCPYFQAP